MRRKDKMPFVNLTTPNKLIGTKSMVQWLVTSGAFW